MNVPTGLPKFEVIAVRRSPSAAVITFQGVYARKLLADSGTTAPSGGVKFIWRKLTAGRQPSSFVSLSATGAHCR